MGRVLVVSPLAKDYGKRKRLREIAKAPLLAQVPGFIPEADEYEAHAIEGRELSILHQRHQLAESWWRVLVWRRRASETMRELFDERWNRPGFRMPHSPEYALDLITQLRREG